jgi:DNA-binding transcriptional LysR family regulator
VARLEAEIGAQLLHRSTRHVSLSTAGATLYQRSAPLLASLRRAVDTLPEREVEPSGLLRLTAPNDVGARLLAELVARFTARHPAVQVDVHLTNRNVELVAEGFDLALRASSRPLKDSSLVARRLTGFDVRLLASPAYLARRGTPRTPKELAGHDWVVFRPGRNPLRLEGPGAVVELELRGHIVCDDLAFAREAVRAGAGIGVLPMLFVEAEVAAGELVRVLPRHSLSAGSLYIVHPAARHLPLKITAFRDFLLESLKAHTD